MKINSRVVLFIISILLFTFIGKAQTYRQFSGRVLDRQTLFPLSDVRVWTDATNFIQTNEKGDFSIKIIDTLINLYLAAPEYDTLFYFVQHDNVVDRLLYLFPNGYVKPQRKKIPIEIKIVDGKTKQPIPFVYISDKYGSAIDMTDDYGVLSTMIDDDIDTLILNNINYSELKVAVSDLDSGAIISLAELTNELQTVWIRAKRSKYSNKDNPAVALMRKVIDAKQRNYISDSFNTLKYNLYEKTQMGNYDMPRLLTHNFFTKRQAFVFENIDTIKYKPHGITPLYIQEKYSNVYFKDEIKNRVDIPVALKKVKFNENFIANKSIDNYLSHIYINFDLKDDNVMVMTNQFMSPMAKFSPTFYKFFLGDTIVTEGKKLVEMYFGPRNKNDFLFLGRLYINLDNYAVEFAKMGISKDINLNFIKDITFDIHYDRLPSGQYLMSYNNIFVDFNLANDSKFGLYGEKLLNLKDIKLNEVLPDTLWNKNKNEYIDEDSLMKVSAKFWDTIRPIPLSIVEETAYKNMDSLYHQKGFNQKLRWMRFLFMGYITAGNVEIGPTNTFYAFNPIEGFRLRAGGRTMINNTKRYHIEGYGAYGFRDQKWKYYISGSLGLYKDKNRLLTEYPYNYLKFTHQNDLLLPGQQPGFVQEGSFFLSFKRGTNDKFLYNNYYKLEYVREFQNHIRFAPYVQWNRQQPAGSWYYIKGDEFTNDTITSTVNTVVGFGLRWAPNEKIIQGRTSRTQLNNKYPIFHFNASFALKDVLGGSYEYQNYNFGLFKRFLIPQMGFINVRAGANYINGKGIPFTLLHVASGNQTYWLNTSQYMLMNYMEFISDKNVNVNIDYHLYGFIFNKIPLLKKLKFREVVGVKLLYGSISDANMPIINPDVIKFPLNEQGVYTTTALGRLPYIESFVGIENILGVFRVDAIWRNTYKSMPNVSPFGVRVGAFFDF